MGLEWQYRINTYLDELNQHRIQIQSKGTEVIKALNARLNLTKRRTRWRRSVCASHFGHGRRVQITKIS